MKHSNLIFVDCEAPFGCPSPATGDMTELGAVHYESGETFYMAGCEREKFEVLALWVRRHCPEYATFISDNPAYDWQWVNFYFDKYGIVNPFGHSARRIGDFYAGLVGDFARADEWKSLRTVVHDHNPVHDAQGNAGAFRRMLNGERGQRR